MIKCPLCNSEDIVQLSTVNSRDIIWLYNHFPVNTEKLFVGIEYLTYNRCNLCKLRFFYPFVEGDDDFYYELQKQDWYFLHENKTEYEYSRSFIKPSDKVLDVGSGRGVFAKYINCAFYQGLDTSTQAIHLAQKDGRNVINETIQTHSKINKNYYDVVVSFQVLEHIAEIRSFLQSCLDVLAPEGLFIIAVPNNDSFLQYANNNTLNITPHHQLHWNETSLRYLDNIYDVQIISVFKEPVTEIHKNWFLTTVILNQFRKVFRLNYNIIDNSIQYRILFKISSKLAKVFMKIKLPSNIPGHSIIVVFKKQNKGS